MKKIVWVFYSMLWPLISKAQLNAATAKGFWDDSVNHPLFPIYLISFFVFIIFVLTLVTAMIVLKVLNLFVEKVAIEKAERLGKPYTPPQNGWARFWEKANALVPLEEEKNIVLDHDYDGIRELDNHLPPWWKGLFYGSIVFAVVYLALFHISNSLPLSAQEYQNEVSLAEAQASALKASQPAEVIDENNLLFTNDVVQIAKGKSVFMSNNCGSCHRNDGGGNTIGPNLTDEYWLHGGDIKNIFATIKNGVVEKAMPAWGKVMSQKDVRDVAFYVMSLHGTHPPNGKPAQGELFREKQKPKPADSAKVVKK